MIERDEHYSLFQRQQKTSPPCPRSPQKLDYVEEFFKYTELSRAGRLNRFAPKNPYKNDFDSFVEEFMKKHKQLPEEEALRKLYSELECKQKNALGSLRRVVNENACMSNMQQRIPNIGT